MTRTNACVYQSYIQQQLAGIFSRFKSSELNNCEFKIQRNFTSHWLFAINISQKISDPGELEGNSFLTYYYFVNKTLKPGDGCLVLPTLAQDQAAEQFGESVNILFVPKYKMSNLIFILVFLNLQSNDLC